MKPHADWWPLRGWTLEHGMAPATMADDNARQDRDDIAASLNGDEDAFARIVARYQGTVSQQMWRFTRDRNELDELVQEVFVEVFTSLHSYRATAPFLHWLRRVATRTGYRYWKRQGRARERRAALEADRALLHPPEQAAPTEAAEYTFELLAQLPPDDRLVLTLLYFEALDTRAIAERMGWSRTLVKVRAHRARKRLRGLLEEAGYGRPGNDGPADKEDDGPPGGI